MSGIKTTADGPIDVVEMFTSSTCKTRDVGKSVGRKRVWGCQGLSQHLPRNAQ